MSLEPSCCSGPRPVEEPRLTNLDGQATGGRPPVARAGVQRLPTLPGIRGPPHKGQGVDSVGAASVSDGSATLLVHDPALLGGHQQTVRTRCDKPSETPRDVSRSRRTCPDAQTHDRFITYPMAPTQEVPDIATGGNGSTETHGLCGPHTQAPARRQSDEFAPLWSTLKAKEP